MIEILEKENTLSLLENMLRRIDLERLSRLRGKAHEGIIGEWIRWWLGADPNNYVYNPAPYANNKSADIMFLGLNRDLIHAPYGIAEIENNFENWFGKLESLQSYVLDKRFSDLVFVLLCVTMTESKANLLRFDKLAERMETFSTQKPDPYWILCGLVQSPPKEETCLVFFEGDEVERKHKRSISSCRYLFIKEGEIKSELVLSE